MKILINKLYVFLKNFSLKLSIIYTPLFLYGIIYWHFFIWNASFILLSSFLFFIELFFFRRFEKKAEKKCANWNEVNLYFSEKEKMNFELYFLLFLSYIISNISILDKILFENIFNSNKENNIFYDKTISIIFNIILFLLINFFSIKFISKIKFFIPLAVFVYYKYIYFIDVKTKDSYIEKSIFLSKDKINELKYLKKELNSGKKEIRNILGFSIIYEKKEEKE